MSNPSSTPPAAAPREPRAAHLTVLPEGIVTRDELFLFQQQEKRIGNALGVSVASHLASLRSRSSSSAWCRPKVYNAVVPDKFEDLDLARRPRARLVAAAAATRVLIRPRRSSCLASRR
jgi:hypothetical protein